MLDKQRTKHSPNPLQAPEKRNVALGPARRGLCESVLWSGCQFGVFLVVVLKDRRRMTVCAPNCGVGVFSICTGSSTYRKIPAESRALGRSAKVTVWRYMEPRISLHVVSIAATNCRDTSCCVLPGVWYAVQCSATCTITCRSGYWT